MFIFKLTDARTALTLKKNSEIDFFLFINNCILKCIPVFNW